jgi:parallel beta-helix repeat protein
MKLKKAVLVLVATLVLLFTPLLVSQRASAETGSTVIYVPNDFTQIQDAINNAVAGDTIFVHNGTYDQDIYLNKSVSLVGQSRETTVIIPSLQQANIQIAANDVSVINLTVSNNVAASYGYGILVSSSHNVTISNDTIQNYLDGVIVSASFGVNISDCSIDNNAAAGVKFDTSHDNDFSENTVSGNLVGLEFVSSSNDNTITGNTFGNDGLCVSLSRSRDNLFWHNNFINGLNVISDSSNIWDKEGEGNYWSGNTGVDLNGDGISDTPYPIDAEVDLYPLMGMFNGFQVTSEGMNYGVSVIGNETVSRLTFQVGPETGNGIIQIELTNNSGNAGFCRLTVPTALMQTPYIVLDVSGEIQYTTLNGSNLLNAYLYFTYPSTDDVVNVVSSKTLQLYLLLSEELSANQTALIGYLASLNSTYLNLLGNYTGLQSFLSQLQNSYAVLNDSYEQHLASDTHMLQNLQNLTYVFGAMTIVFLVTTVYLAGRGRIRSEKD